MRQLCAFIAWVFPLQQTLHAGGKLMVNSDHGPTWNMNIGFFDASDYSGSMSGAQESGGGDAVRLAIIEQSPDFRLRLEMRQQGNGSPSTTPISILSAN